MLTRNKARGGLRLISPSCDPSRRQEDTLTDEKRLTFLDSVAARPRLLGTRLADAEFEKVCQALQGLSPIALTDDRPPLPAAWLIAELEACFVVIDSAGQKLAYVYYEEEPGRRPAAKLLSKDAARRIAANVAKLPELLGRKD